MRPPEQNLLKYTHNVSSLKETVRLSKNIKGYYCGLHFKTMWQGLDCHISETGETLWIKINKIFYIVILVSQVRPPEKNKKNIHFIGPALVKFNLVFTTSY